jgi:hypothetical protein
MWSFKESLVLVKIRKSCPEIVTFKIANLKYFEKNRNGETFSGERFNLMTNFLFRIFTLLLIIKKSQYTYHFKSNFRIKFKRP